MPASSSTPRRYSTRTSPSAVKTEGGPTSLPPSEDGSAHQLSLEDLDLSSSHTRTPFSPSGSDDSQLPTTSLNAVDYDDGDFVVGGMADKGSRRAGGGKAQSSAKAAKRQQSANSSKRGSIASEVDNGEDDEDDEDGKLGRKTSLRTRNRLKQRLHRERRARHLETLESQISLVPQLQTQVANLESTLAQTQNSLQNATTQLAAAGAQMHAYEALLRDMQGRELQREQMVRWFEAEVLKLRGQVGAQANGPQQNGQTTQNSPSGLVEQDKAVEGRTIAEGGSALEGGYGQQSSGQQDQYAVEAGPSSSAEGPADDKDKDWNTVTPTAGRALDQSWFMGGGGGNSSDPNSMAPSPAFNFPPFPFPQQPQYFFGSSHPPPPPQSHAMHHQHHHHHFSGPPPPPPHSHYAPFAHGPAPQQAPSPAPQQFSPQPYGSSPYGSPVPHLLPPHLRPQSQAQSNQRANLAPINTTPPASQASQPSNLPTPMMTAASANDSKPPTASSSSAPNGTPAGPSHQPQPAMNQFGYPSGPSVYSSFSTPYGYLGHLQQPHAQPSAQPASQQPAAPGPSGSASSTPSISSSASTSAPPPPRPVLTLASPGAASSPAANPSPPTSTAPPNPLLSTLAPLQTQFQQPNHTPTLALSPIGPSPISTFSYHYTTTGQTPGGMMLGTPTQWGYGVGGGGLSAGGWGSGTGGMWPWAGMGGGSGMSPITPGGGMMVGISPLDGPRDGGRPF